MTRALASLLVLAMVGAASTATAQTVEFKDPTGDDKGPGNYEYPTDPVYKRGSFDMTAVTIADKGDSLEVSITVNAKIDDPWQSKNWDGNGFSVQMAFLFIDTDHKAGSGHVDALPGLNVKFAEESRWEKALVISPQGKRRLSAEIGAKCKTTKQDIIMPKSVRVRGRTLVARFPKSGLGTLSKGWGFQVLMQSNEGYPDKTDLLTRKVNEYKGKHRFGGGSDYNCDPHVMDMLAGKGKGEASEAQAQYTQLKAWKCNDADPESGGTQAVVSMIYPE